MDINNVVSLFKWLVTAILSLVRFILSNLVVIIIIIALLYVIWLYLKNKYIKSPSKKNQALDVQK